MAHDHQHAGSEGANTRRLAITLGLVVAYMGIEVAGGLLANSLALIADAGHMFSDAAALGLTLFAMRFAVSLRRRSGRTGPIVRRSSLHW